MLQRANSGRSLADLPMSTRHIFQSPDFGRESSQEVSVPEWLLIIIFLAFFLNPGSALKKSSSVRRLCSTKWLQSLERTGIFAQNRVRFFTCMEVAEFEL